MPAETHTWAIAEAKAHFSELIEQAITAGPQLITRSGNEAAVVVSAAEWAEKTRRKGTLAQFFAASPLRGSDVSIERAPEGARDIDL
ncbi:MAG TPA: type II toxin-antitoxin system Phd/YefM family antitoxin [Chloroflexota bacterium]|nr:type II toxin-antitoxin system Phd/YefM family antitoxin [Chloroflexota bacterium]